MITLPRRSKVRRSTSRRPIDADSGSQMRLVAVGALHQQHVDLGRGDRVAQERHAQPADVAREHQAHLAALLLQFEHNAGRAQDVAGLHQAGDDARHGLEGLVVGVHHQMIGHRRGIGCRVQRLDRLETLALALLVEVLDIGFLDVARVAQRQVGQVHRGGRGVDRSTEALPHQVRQVAAVVDVGVREDDGVQAARVEGEVAVDGVGDRRADPGTVRIRAAVGGR